MQSSHLHLKTTVLCFPLVYAKFEGEGRGQTEGIIGDCVIKQCKKNNGQQKRVTCFATLLLQNELNGGDVARV